MVQVVNSVICFRIVRILPVQAAILQPIQYRLKLRSSGGTPLLQLTFWWLLVLGLQGGTLTSTPTYTPIFHQPPPPSTSSVARTTLLCLQVQCRLEIVMCPISREDEASPGELMFQQPVDKMIKASVDVMPFLCVSVMAAVKEAV